MKSGVWGVLRRLAGTLVRAGRVRGFKYSWFGLSQGASIGLMLFLLAACGSGSSSGADPESNTPANPAMELDNEGEPAGESEPAGISPEPGSDSPSVSAPVESDTDPVVEQPLTPGLDNLGLGDIQSDSYFQFANNSTRLDGPVIGSGTVANVTLRKGVDFELLGGLQGAESLTVEKVVAVREVFQPERYYVIAYIKNISEVTRCGILFDDIELVDSSGERLAVPQHFFTMGGIDIRADRNRTVSHCLRAGDSGYHVIAGNSGSFTYDSVASVVFSLGHSFNISGSHNDIPGSVDLLSYTVGTDPEFGDPMLTLVVQNNLDRTFYYTGVFVHALDESGQPVGYGFNGQYVPFNLAPGEQTEITAFIDTQGTASSIRASVLFTEERALSQ